MATSAKQLIEDAVRKHREVSGTKGAAAHPAARDEAGRLAALAVAQSHVELATAVQSLTEALGKNQAEFNKTVAALTATLAERAKR